MQVRDTPLRVNERGATVTLSVGAGGSGIYYGPSESSVKTNTAAPGAQVTITSPMYVQSQGLRDGPPADLDVLGGDTTLPSSGSSGPATLTYDAQGRLATASAPGSTITAVSYDSQGRLSAFTENGTARTLTYDPTTGLLTGVS